MALRPDSLSIERIARVWVAETNQPGVEASDIAEDLVDSVLRGEFQFPADYLHVEDIERMLSEKAQQLVQELLPNGHREGPKWVAVRDVVWDGPNGKFCVHIVGKEAGTWEHVETGHHGNALKLIAYLDISISYSSFGEKKRAVRWAIEWLGLNVPANIGIILGKQIESYYNQKEPITSDELKKYINMWQEFLGTPIEAARQRIAREVYISAAGLRQWCSRPEFSGWAQFRRISLPNFVEAVGDKTVLSEPNRTGMPGRPSIAQLILAEFCRRAEAGLVLPGLAAEARQLHTWATESHLKAPTPTPRTIENHIRDAHRRAFKKATK